MAAPATVHELLELVRKSELVPLARLDASVDQIKQTRAVSTPREMASLLVAAGLITGFQAEQFLQGKWRGFQIGKYRVLERVGSGGMGTVYLCEHQLVGRKVAIKVLPTSQADNPSALGRFYREARAAGVLDHPNLVKAHDVDQDGNIHFLVMDYVDGTSLQELVARFGPMPHQKAASHVRQAAMGLQAAHVAGLVHRDVKPANIMLERTGAIRVLDLGLARFFHDHTDMLTLQYDDKNVLGTADYVAPEQALNSHEVDIRADIYGLGATFYFLLTGQPPFPDGKIAQKLIWHQVRQPTPVRKLRPEVPEGLAMILERMMAKNPDQRFQTPQEVALALLPWVPETLPLPLDEEMPRLSPAVNIPAASGLVPLRPSGSVPLPPPPMRRSTSVPRVNKAPESSGQVVALHRPASATELATPRHLARAETATDASHPGKKDAEASLKVLQKIQGASPEGQAFATTALRFLVMALLSCAIGVLLPWILMRR